MPQDVTKSDAEWRAELDPDAYAVLRKGATEPPFSGALNHNKADGQYRCGACGAVLFGSDTKFESGSGWPSFTEPADREAVELIEDRSLGMTRVEVRCGTCHSHLGHVFDDGPVDQGGQRYCMNSLALQFTPAEGDAA